MPLSEPTEAENLMPIKNVFSEIKSLTQSIENLSVADFVQEQQASEDLLLVDLREIQERVDLGTIPNSKHVPRGMLEFWADPASPYYREFFEGEDQRIVVFCAGGGRSVYAALALQDMGYRNVAHIADGFRGWKESDNPIEDVAATSRWVRR
jgi:rhodanese-related sulfurtransferase